MPMQDDMKTESKQSAANTLTYVLEPVRNNAVESIELQVGDYRIGSSQQCDLCLDVAGVAPEHCRITCHHGIISLQTDDPRTWLNDGPVKKARVNVGDRLTIGPVSFLFRTRVDRVTSQNSSEREEDLSVQLASRLPEAIQSGRIDRSAKQLINSVSNSTNETSIGQVVEELHQSLNLTQKKFESHRDALNDKPENSAKSAQSELIPLQKTNSDPVPKADPAIQKTNIESSLGNLNEREQAIRIRKEQILRLTKRMTQRRIADEAVLGKAHQQLEARQLELIARERELDQWEQAIENNKQLEQREDKQRICELESAIHQLQEEAEQQRKVQLIELESRAIQLAKREAEQARLADYEDRITEVEDQIIEQTRQLEQSESQILSQSEMLDRQTGELQSLQAEKFRLQELEATANQDIDKFQQQIAYQLEEINEVQTLVEEMQSQQDLAEQTAVELQKVQNDLFQVQQELEEENQSRLNIREQLQNCQEALKTAETQSEQVADELAECQRQQEELLSQNVDLRSALEDSYSKVSAVTEELQQHKTELESSSERNAELTGQIAQLIQQYESLEKECNEVHADSEQAREQVNSLEQQLEEMTAELKQNVVSNQAIQEESETLKATISEFEQGRDKYQAETDELLSEFESLRKQYKTLHAEYLELQEEIEDLQSELKMAQNSPDMNEEHEAELQSLRSDIVELERTASDQQDLLESSFEELEHLRNRESQYDRMRSELDQEWEKLSDERDRLVELKQDIENERAAFQQSRLDLDQLRQEIAEQQAELLRAHQHAAEINELSQDEQDCEILEHEEVMDGKAPDTPADEIDYAESVENALSVTASPHSSSPETSGDVRKRIAEMFGLIDDAVAGTNSQKELSETCEDDDRTDEESNEENLLQDEEELEESFELEDEEEKTVEKNSKQVGDVVVDDIEDADSVAAYMERLFARTNGKQEYQSPKPVEKSVAKPAAAPKSLSLETENSSMEDSYVNILPEKMDPAAPPKQPIAKIDREAVMREIASLREVANQTARTALITHKWKHLRLKFMLNTSLTAISALGTLVLLAAPFWHGDQFLMYAASMGGLAMVSGYSLLQNYVTLKRMKNPVGRPKNTERIDELKEPDETS